MSLTSTCFGLKPHQGPFYHRSLDARIAAQGDQHYQRSHQVAQGSHGFRDCLLKLQQSDAGSFSATVFPGPRLRSTATGSQA